MSKVVEHLLSCERFRNGPLYFWWSIYNSGLLELYWLNSIIKKLYTVFCLIRATGTLACSYLRVWGKSIHDELSNGGFRLKIGQLLRKLHQFWWFMAVLASFKLKGAPLLGEAPLIGRIRYDKMTDRQMGSFMLKKGLAQWLRACLERYQVRFPTRSKSFLPNPGYWKSVGMTPGVIYHLQ